MLAVTDPSNGQSMDAILSFLEENDVTALPIGLDQHMALHARLGVDSLPMTYVVDREGIIRERIVGEITREQIVEIVNNLHE